MWISDYLEPSFETLYEKKICKILEVPKEFIPEIKKTLVKKNMNLERFLELWEFCNEFDEETYLILYKKIFKNISCVNPNINMSCLIFWKLFDHIVINQHYLKVVSKIYDEVDKKYVYINFYQNKNGRNILTSYFSIYKCFIDLAFRNHRCDIDVDLYSYFEKELFSMDKNFNVSTRYPFFFKKSYVRYLCKKLKTYSKIIGKLILYYHKILEQRYVPDGKGYRDAKYNWYLNL